VHSIRTCRFVLYRSDAAFSRPFANYSPPQTPATTAESALAYGSLEISSVASSTGKVALPYLSTTDPPVHLPAASRAIVEEHEETPMSSVMRFLTGIVVTGAAAVLLLQLLPAFAAPPLMADTYTHHKCPSADADAHASPEHAGPTTGYQRTVSWLRTLSMGASSQHSQPDDWTAAKNLRGISRASSGKRGSGRSIAHDQCPDPNEPWAGHSSGGVGQNAEPGTCANSLRHGRQTRGSFDSLSNVVSPPLCSPRGICHAVSADDLAQVGAPVGGGNNNTVSGKSRVPTQVSGSWEAPATVNRSLSPLHSRGAHASAPDMIAAAAHKHMHSSQLPAVHAKRAKPCHSASCGALPLCTAAVSPEEMVVPCRRRGKSLRVGGDGLTLQRSARKRIDHCNIEGCMYRPWTVLSAAMFHQTAEFHHCSRCQRDFCVNHMAWVTHAKTLMAKCPLDARCICELCWIELRRHGTPVPTIGMFLPQLSMHDCQQS
jgi:hypothetical protein